MHCLRGAFPSSARIVARAITGVVRIAYSFAAVAYCSGSPSLHVLSALVLDQSTHPRSHHHRAKLLGHSSQIQQQLNPQGQGSPNGRGVTSRRFAFSLHNWIKTYHTTVLHLADAAF